MLMRDFIEAVLRKVLLDFNQSAAQARGLCACKGLTYEAGGSPDYNDAMVQQLYMLRYFPAYLVEYYIMYESLLETNHLPDNLNVLSIGCGCGLDLWGLYFALKRRGRDCATTIKYTGVDLTPWQYRYNMDLPNVRFIQQDITAWQTLDRNDYNVFVFPKCIGEFPPEVFKKICNMFSHTSFLQDRVCGLCSLMNIGINSDIDRYKQGARAMEEGHGFQVLDSVDEYWQCEKDEGLRKVCSDFIYPNDVLKNVKDVFKLCPRLIANGLSCEPDCEGQLNKSPILKTSFIKYQVLRFERQAQTT